MNEFDCRCCLLRSPAKKHRERLSFVSSLDLLDIVEVAGIKELRAENYNSKISFMRNTFLIPAGFSPFQRGPVMRKLPPSLPVVRLPM